MNKAIRLMLVSAMLFAVVMVAAAPAYSAQVSQVFSCEEEDEATETNLKAAAAEWGLFWDGYEGSPASKVDQGSQSKAICPDSALWEVVEIK